MSAKVRIIAAFCLSILILILIGFYSYQNTNSYKDASEWVTHSQQVITEAEHIVTTVQDMETSQRGYLITNDKRYLQGYKRGLNTIHGSFDKVRSLISDNESQQMRLDSVEQTVNRKILFVKTVVNVMEKEGFESARQLVISGTGEELMKETYSKINDFIEEEKKLLSIRLEEAHESYVSAITILLISIGLTIVIVLTALYYFLRDFNRRQLYSKQLKAQKRQIDLLAEFQKIILDGSDYCIITTGERGIITSFNKGAEKLLGYRAAELVGKTTPALLHDPAEVVARAKVLTQELGMDIEPGIDVFHIKSRLGFAENVAEWSFLKKDGSRIPVELSISALHDKENGMIGYLGIAKDITERKKAQEAIIQAKEIAEQANELKETFLANMSHEIRTPMNAIIGFTNLLLKRPLGEQERDYVQTINNSGETLLRIINDILDVSKINSGMMSFEEHPISLHELFGSLQTMLEHRAHEKKLELIFTLDNAVPATVLGDPTRFTQIIINLVGNGIKFTNQGSVKVIAKLLSENEKSCWIEFAVTDTGIGIPADKLEHIFERFMQAESHTTRTYGGTGLGLSIAKQLVELQGGTINIESTVGKGSSFTFVLPFKKTDQAFTKHKPSKKFDPEAIRNIRILVVEDNMINIKFVQTLFADIGVKADMVTNGRLALDQLNARPYDLVLMDIEMPELNGYETTTVIRQELKNNVPIIAMTAHAMSGEREKCLQMGMNDYISKPIDADLLFQKMGALVSLPDLPEPKNQPPMNSSKLINLEFLEKTMRGNKESILEMIDLFMTHTQPDLDAIAAAIKVTDFNVIRSRAHNLKSSVGILGMTETVVILQEMELLAKESQDLHRITVLNQTLNQHCEQAKKELIAERVNYENT